MKEHPIKNTAFWMTLVINPCHGRDRDSGNGPEQNLPDILPQGRPLFYQCSFSITVNKGRHWKDGQVDKCRLMFRNQGLHEEFLITACVFL